MHSAWTSLDMQSGAKPLASIVRAVLNANDPDPVADIENDDGFARV